MREEMKMMVNMMGNKVDEIVLKTENDQMVSQSKEGINSLTKEQLPGHDCGCSGDGGAGDWSAVCDCAVGKSCGA
nr:hypothetical protein BgiMline_025631 [Biomphalaria glabrata]